MALKLSCSDFDFWLNVSAKAPKLQQLQPSPRETNEFVAGYVVEEMLQ